MTRSFMIVSMLLLGSPAWAGTNEEFELANRAYAEGRYEEAAAGYERLVAEGARHENLFYNLGNAYYRAGKLGHAVLSYERVLSISPDAEDALYNLDVARGAVAEKLGKDVVVGAISEPFWVRLVGWFPESALAWLVFGVDVLFFGLLIAIWFLPTGFLRTGLVVGEVFLGLAGVLLGIVFLVQVAILDKMRHSVVVADEVVMREAPDRARRETVKLHAGHRLVVVGENEDWYKVRLANQVEGWVPRESVEEI